jgi:hypothetical protein
MLGLLASSLEGCHSTEESVAAIPSEPELWKYYICLLAQQYQEVSFDEVADAPSNILCPSEGVLSNREI